MLTVKIRLVSVLCATFLAGCASAPNKPIATLRYLAMEPSGKYGYDMLFTSDIDLTDLYDRTHTRVAQVGTNVVCALGEDRVFDVNHNTQLVIQGWASQPASQRPDGQFLLRMQVMATNKQFGSTERLAPSTITTLLNGKTAIPCKAWVTAYFFKAYYSHTMYVPTADILKTLGKPTPARE